MLPRATENDVAGRYLPSPGLGRSYVEANEALTSVNIL